jgi:hypothetical protein
VPDPVLKRVRDAIRNAVAPGISPHALAPSAVPLEERERTDLHRLFYGHQGALVHKWRNYPGVYDRYLARYRGGPVRVLEIGVSQGGSLQLWRRYFGPQATLFGIDVDPRCARLDGTAASIRIGSQDDPDFLRAVVAEMGGIDVVIDDGSHVARHQRRSFDVLFPLLASPGTYICEDLHTSYWRLRFGGGYRRRSAFIEVAKRIVDDMHGDFHRRRLGLADAHRLIEGIHFHNSMVVIEKATQPAPAHLTVGERQFG